MTDSGVPSGAVVFVLPIGLTLGGSNSWSLRLAGRLAAAGRNVALVEHTCVDWHPRLDMALPAGVRHVTCPGTTPVNADAGDVEGYAEVYRELLPAAFVPNFSAAAYAACARLTVDQPEAVRVLGVAHGHSKHYVDVLRHYEPVIHTFVATNHAMDRELREGMPERAGDVALRPCAVDAPAELRREPRAVGQPLRLTYAGRITNHEKRVSDLVPLAKELDRLGVNFTLRVVGEGGYRKWLLREVAGLDEPLRKRIAINDMVAPDRMSAVWDESDVCLLVSDTESGGISMLEAMARGCVPVSTRTEGPSEIIRHGQNGFLSDVGDVRAMAGIIQSLEKDRASFPMIGKKAWETVRASFSQDAYVPWFAGLLDELWRKPPRRWPEGRPLLPARKAESGWRNMIGRLFRMPAP